MATGHKRVWNAEESLALQAAAIPPQELWKQPRMCPCWADRVINRQGSCSSSSLMCVQTKFSRRFKANPKRAESPKEPGPEKLYSVT